MARMKIRHLVEKPNADGSLRYYWQPTAELRTAGFAGARLADARGLAIEEAERKNEAVDRWRAEQAAGIAAGPKGPHAGSVADLVRRFKRSEDWARLAPKTQRDYGYALGLIEAWAGDAPLEAITPQRIQKFHAGMAWKRDKDGARVPHHPAKANAAVRVLRLLLEHARREGELEVNPALRPRLSDTAKKGRLWSPDAIAAMVAAADGAGFPSIGTAILLDEWLGQREGDLLALPLNAWRPAVGLHVVQSKTGAEVLLPVDLVPHLVARLEAELARARARAVTATTLLVCEATGLAWTADRFRHELAKIRDAAADAAMARQAHALAAEIRELWFMHLRHTAVTRLAEANVELAAIAAVTGHSLATVHEIVDRYLVRTGKLARAAFQRRLDAEKDTENR